VIADVRDELAPAQVPIGSGEIAWPIHNLRSTREGAQCRLNGRRARGVRNESHNRDWTGSRLSESLMSAARRLLLTATFLLLPCAAFAAPLLDADFIGLPVGYDPSLLAAGDLTEDGVDDLVVSDASGIACLVALGDGEFAPAVRVDARIASALRSEDVNRSSA